MPSIAAPVCLPSLAQPLDERCRRLLHLLELGRVPFDERGLLDHVDAVPIQGRAWQGSCSCSCSYYISVRVSARVSVRARVRVRVGVGVMVRVGVRAGVRVERTEP